MKFLQWFFAFYINSSIHIALAVLALSAVTVFEFDLMVSFELWAYVFLASITGYNFVKYANIATIQHHRMSRSLVAIRIFSVLCVVLLFFIMFFLPLSVVVLSVVFGILTVLYAVPVVRHKSLRNLTGTKIFIVAFVWAGFTVMVPVVTANAAFSYDIFLSFLQRILIVIVLMVPFEIRDISRDAMDLRTLPQQLGLKGTKLFGEVLLVIVLILEFSKKVYEREYRLGLLIFLVALGILVIVSKPTQSRYFASFWIEGLPVLWWLFYFLLNKLKVFE